MSYSRRTKSIVSSSHLSVMNYNKNEKVQHLTKWCHELERGNEQAKELKKRHHELEQENAALEQQVGLANMRAEELYRRQLRDLTN